MTQSWCWRARDPHSNEYCTLVVIEEVFERSWSPLVVCPALKDAPALMISSSMRGRGGSCHACAMTHQVFHSARQLEMSLKTMALPGMCNR